jgi:D-arabinose 1-dehydrogenase-like Zn-dependent alcohol dehydrogenase
MSKTKAYAAASAKSPPAATSILRRDPTARDVELQALCCGICHSDFHSVRDEWNSFMPTNLTLVVAPSAPLGVSAFGLIVGRRSLSGSRLGGIAETQEMLDFCGAHDITADVEAIPFQKVNEAFERLLQSDVRHRFCIDMASL